MSLPSIFIVTESQVEIKKLMKPQSAMIAKRLQALLVFKKHEKGGISKREVADIIGVNHNSIQTWRKAYIDGGMPLLLSHSKKSNRESVFTKEQEQAIQVQMNNPKNGFVGFAEFLQWFNTAHDTTVNYKTFHGFVVRKFKVKVKTARKSHVKKNIEAVESLKKTLVKPVKKSSPKNRKDIKQ